MDDIRLLIGSSNRGKIMEVRDALKDVPCRCMLPADFGITQHPCESGTAFAENARQKARFYFTLSGGVPTLADDSGIVVDALKNELGIHTRRWGAGPQATDEEWIDFFLDRMRQEEHKRARFTCVLCFIDAVGKERMFEGTCDGVITDALEADFLPGLPISACFKPDGYDKVFSALSVEEKNLVSHRGRALAKLVRQFSDVP